VILRLEKRKGVEKRKEELAIPSVSKELQAAPTDSQNHANLFCKHLHTRKGCLSTLDHPLDIHSSPLHLIL